MKILKLNINLILLFTFLTLPIAFVQGQQNVYIFKGKVIDSLTKKGIAAVSIRDIATGRNATTDQKGEFRIQYQSAPKKAVVFSILGYETKAVNDNGVGKYLTVELAPKELRLEEATVSTGYQIKPRERVTGSFELVGRSQIDRRIHQNVLEQLNGRVASIRFDVPNVSSNVTPKMNIRGRNTIFSNDQPLYILDNMAYDGDITLINSNDIESITVLKDAAASSIWGARAGNGVVVIRTKAGKANDRPTVSFNSSLAYAPKPDLSRLKRVSSSDFIDFETLLFNKGYYDSQLTRPYPVAQTPVVETLVLLRNGLIDAQTASSRIDRLKTIDVRDDVERYLYTNKLVQQYGINIRGGNNALRYFLSANYDHNKEDKVKNSNNRFSIRSNTSYQLGKRLELTSNIVFSQKTMSNLYPSTLNDLTSFSLGSGKFLYPYAELAAEDGSYLPLSNGLRDTFKESAMEKGLLDWTFTPLDEIYHNTSNATNKSTEYLFNPSLLYHPIEGVSLVANYQYQKQVGDQRTLRDRNSYDVRNLINRFAQASATGLVSFPVPVGDILQTEADEQRSQQGRIQANFERSFATDHHLDAMLGMEVRENKIVGHSNIAYGYAERGLVSVPVDYVTRYKYYDASGSGNIPYGVNMTSTTTRFFSYFGNLAYTYKGKYSLSGSARVDQSNLFGVKTNNRKVPLWSVGGLWHIHQENWFKTDWINKLSLRSTFGYSGNVGDAVGITTITLSNAYLTNAPRADVQNPPNESLRWEKNRLLNFGLDFGFFKNRLSGSLEYYAKRNTDLLSNSDIDPTTGLGNLSGKSVFLGNVATTTGNGVDLTLNTVNIRQPKFGWESTIVFSVNHSKVKEYYSQSTTAQSYINSNNSVTPLIGYPVYTVFGYQWAGLDAENGMPRGYLDGEISNEYSKIMNAPVGTLAYHGPAKATVFGALTNTLRYGDLSLTFNLDYRFGSYFKRSSISYGMMATSWTGHADYADRWQQPGDEKRTDVPALVYPFNGNATSFYIGSSALVEKADYIALHDVYLDYTVRPELLKRYGIKSLVLKGYVSNLGYLWLANSRGLDPFYENTIRPQKSFTLGLNLTF